MLSNDQIKNLSTPTIYTKDELLNKSARKLKKLYPDEFEEVHELI